jgi:cyclophilin family peptidyl-prolyl cis-trans isomerase
VSPKSKVRKKPVKHRDPRAQARLAAIEEAKRSTRRKWAIPVVILLVVIVIFGVFSVVDDEGGTGVETSSPSSTVPADRRTPVSLPTPAKGAAITGDTPCPNADGSSPRTTSFAKPPPMCIVPTRTYTADMQTSKGLVTIALYPQTAPLAVNNFVVLSRYHYFDTLPFHRIVSGFVVQGGSVDATGNGGPGYQFPDEVPAAGAYRVGSVAMANSGANTNGSQFFIVVGDAAVLEPKYSLFGEVTGGIDVVRAIEAAGIPQGAPNVGQPTEVVTIQSVTIKET